MSLCATTLFFLLAMATTINSSLQDIKVLEMAQSQVLQARNWIQSSMRFHGSVSQFDLTSVALRDCGKLYEDSEFRLAYLVSGESNYSGDDARTWLRGVMANHLSCLDGLSQKGYVKTHDVGSNLTMLLDEALVLYKKSPGKGQSMPRGRRPIASVGNLASWSPATSKADFTVAQDGSGTHKDAVAALAGLDKTIVTGNRNVMQGSTTLSSATFDVSGDGFWARDMTFENTAGPHRHQAVALKVSSDLSIFYRCSFKGNGASTENRVNWPGFHVFKSSVEASPFTVSQFIHGERWIPASGVPFWPGI
ncbi:Pectinesterase [Quillaja saponaria]|uniref:Pectinesterase n=1 Tax=Quillaja saponaria TaxID=32244 RepID=A0AAD7LQ44_QUISA|nr:Pectinesterase [Quillaja saponaria]